QRRRPRPPAHSRNCACVVLNFTESTTTLPVDRARPQGIRRQVLIAVNASSNQLTAVKLPGTALQYDPPRESRVSIDYPQCRALQAAARDSLRRSTHDPTDQSFHAASTACSFPASQALRESCNPQ